tara:strand:- start:1316 stop:1495 length:180 start_codon:yes stop_codon:yes gene_type:complete
MSKPKRRVVLTGKLEVLTRIAAFCRHQLYYVYGPKEGERRFGKLRMTTAVEWWKARKTP